MNIWILCVDVGYLVSYWMFGIYVWVICHQRWSELCLKVAWKITALYTNKRIL